ncbi:MAG: hypothetical protein WC154_03630, partial [Candidatus Izemoplasmatales bacterium]
MKKIINLIKENEEIKQIISLFKANENIYIKNTNEDNALLALLSIFFNNNQTIFVATPNLYKAQILYDKLSRVLDKDEISFFPQDEFLTSELLVSSIEFKLERINTIIKILSMKKRIVIVNLFGLLKPQLPAEKWENSKINFTINQDYNLDEIKNKLIEYGYKNEYTVEKIGD